MQVNITNLHRKILQILIIIIIVQLLTLDITDFSSYHFYIIFIYRFIRKNWILKNYKISLNLIIFINSPYKSPIIYNIFAYFFK